VILLLFGGFGRQKTKPIVLVRRSECCVLRMDSRLRENDKYGTLDGGKFFIKLKKQSQFVPGLISTSSYTERSCGGLTTGRADENKANIGWTEGSA
jgi:hypothetical protein